MVRLGPILFLFIFAFTLKLKATNSYALVVGDVDNPDQNGQFTDDFNNYENLSNSPKWSVTTLRTPQSYSLKSIIDTNLSTQFTKLSYYNVVEDLKQKLNRGELLPGDQLLVLVGAHGYEHEDNQKTHSVMAIDGQVNLDGLQDVIDLAEKKGIKLAIVDESCRSGNILNLDYKNACVMSGASKNGLGYSDGHFSVNLADAAKSKSNPVSLEDVFLKSRLTRGSFAQPLINTPAGIETYKYLDDLGNYLRETDEPRAASECSDHNLEQKNRLDLLKVSLKARISDEKVYDKVMKEFQELAQLKVKYNQGAHDHTMNEIQTSGYICYFEASYNDTKGKNLFDCSIPKYEESHVTQTFSVDTTVSSLDALGNSIRKIVGYEKKKCFSEFTSDPAKTSYKGYKCTNMLDSGKYKNLEKNSDGKKNSEEDQNFYSAFKNIPNTAEYKKAINTYDDKSFNAFMEFTEAKYSIPDKETQIYNDLYSYFSKQEKTKNACADFILNH